MSFFFYLKHIRTWFENGFTITVNVVWNEATAVGLWKFLKHTSPTTTKPSIKRRTKGASLVPMRWSLAWCVSDRSRPISNSMWASGLSTGIGTSYRRGWWVITTGVGIHCDSDAIFWFLLHHIYFTGYKWCVILVLSPGYENFDLLICSSTFIRIIKSIEIIAC